MTKSWWSGEPGEHLLDVAISDQADLDAPVVVSDEADNEPDGGLLNKIPWWVSAIVVVLMVAFVGAIIWLVYDAAHQCGKSTDGCFQPNR